MIFINMTNNININDRNKEKVNQSKFKNVSLYDYQVKTIEKLLEHEKGQMKIKRKEFKLENLYDELRYHIRTTSINRTELNILFNKISRQNEYNFGYNIGVLSNKVGSGKTYIVLGMIMSKDINSFKTLQKYYFDDIYNNTEFDKDVCSVITEYLVEEDDLLLKTSKDTLKKPSNIFKTSRNEVELELMEVNKKTIKNLIVVPHNLYQQWKDEIENHTILDCYFLKTKKDLKKIQEKLENKDLVLCNVNKLKDFLELVQSTHEIDRLFIDEADTINLSNFPEINSKFLWLITTTYERILKPKNQGFISNLFNADYKSTKRILKNILEKLTYTFNAEYIDQKVDLKNPKKKYLIVQNNFINKLFIKLGMTNYYKYIHSYDYQSLYEYMIKLDGYYSIDTYYNKINYITRDFFYLTSNTQQISLNYENESSLLYVYLINLLSSVLGKDMNILSFSTHSYNTQLETLRTHNTNCIECANSRYNVRKLLNENDYIHCKMLKLLVNDLKRQIYLFKRKYNNVLRKKKEFEYIKEQLIINGYCLKCLNRHNYSESCYESVFKNVLEINRINLFESDVILNRFVNRIKILYDFLYDYTYEPDDIESVTNVCLKNENLKIKHMIERLRDDIKNKKRCLLFSDNYNFFKFIETELKNNKINARVLKGNSNTINSILKKYKNYEIDVLLMNMKYCGSGLNLQMSDNIYIMNMIDKNTEKQVIGRVNRINKKGNFEIHYFFNEDEYELYNTEKELTDMLVDNEDIEEIIIEEI